MFIDNILKNTEYVHCCSSQIQLQIILSQTYNYVPFVSPSLQVVVIINHQPTNPQLAFFYLEPPYLYINLCLLITNNKKHWILYIC